MSSNYQLVEFQTIRGEPHIQGKRMPGAPRRFLKLCQEHYYCLSQIAQALSVSSTTLRKAFVAYAGISPKTWMTQQRVMLSIRLIREGHSLTQVAERMVYSDYQHMAKEFRAVVDFTPRSLMKLLKERQAPHTAIE